MSARRAARVAVLDEVVTASADRRIPEKFRIGMCVEVWAPETCRSFDPEAEWPSLSLIARSRFHKALDRWLTTNHGLTEKEVAEITTSGHYRLWSFDFQQLHQPDELARNLKRAGIPPNWTPNRNGIDQ